MHRKKTILKKTFQDLTTKRIPYCILHGYDDLYDESSSDIDLCVDLSRDSTLDRLLSNVCYGRDAKIIQKLFYDIPNSVYYVLSLGDSQLLRLDFFNDNLGINRYFLKSRFLLHHRDFYKEFNIAAPENEAIYLLIKRSIKGSMSVSHQKRFCYLYLKSPSPMSRLVALYFGPQNIIVSKQLFHEEDEEKKRALLAKLKKSLFLRQVLLKPSKWPLIAYYGSIRFIQRVLKPSGIVVCVVSPDGGGKSSVGRELERKLFGAFRRTISIHWRPGLLPQLSSFFHKSRKKINAHETQLYNLDKQGRVLSLIRWIYYSLDFIFGHYLKLLPMKIRTTAIIIDRYYYDLIVDPYRYGFNLPRWLLKFVLPIVPKADLCIYLDNSPEVLHARKQELPPEELRRQVEDWRDFIHELPNAAIVTTDKPINKVVNEAAELVMNRRAEMTKRMLKIEPEGSMYIWKSQLYKSYVALPSKKNCRWLIPTNPVMAEKAWDIYLPYSFWGKLYKDTFKSFAASGFMGMKKVIPQNTEISGKLRNLIEGALRRNDFALAISTGTPGPFRKITAMIISADGTILGYVKIGNALPAIERVKHEASVLKRIKLNEHESNIKLTNPLCIYEGALGHEYFLIQSSPPFFGKSRGYEFNSDYANILCTLIKSEITKKKFGESRFYRQVKYGVQSYSLSFRNLLSDGLKYLEKQISDEEIEFSLSHGDFVPWNIVWNREEAFMFDWESAHFEAPVGIDLAHFLFQTAFLLKKLRGKNLLRYVTAEKAYEILAGRLGLKVTDSRALLLCYLLKMAIDEDREQPLSQSAVERRNLIKVIIKE